MKFSVDLATAHWSSGLMKAYLSNDPIIQPWITHWPSIQALSQVANDRQFSSHQRDLLVRALKNQYSKTKISSATAANIDSLSLDSTFTITTGHQICLATGPLYFIYKIVSAIKLAEAFNSQNPSLKAIPVYWMATEDHDAEEISSIKANGSKFTWDHQQSGAVGAFSTHGVVEWIKQWAPESQKDLLERAYSQSNLAEATRYLVNELFGHYGLVIIDGNDPVLKKEMVSIFQNELTEQPAFKAVSEQTRALNKARFAEQIHPREINLFFLEKGKRTRIERNNDHYQLSDASRSFEKSELLQLVADQPELFSPNVIMRPVYQEVILPNLAYIGGQGELAYWLQLNSYFEQIGVKFPLLILRDSALIVSSRLYQRIQKVGIDLSDLQKDQQQVIKELLQKSAQVDLEQEKKDLTALFDSIVAKAKVADTTLEATAKAELQKQITSLENLEKRFFKALKTKEDVKVQQVQKIWEECFPGNGLQERSENFFAIQSQLQEGIIEKMMECFNPLEHSLKIVVME